MREITNLQPRQEIRPSLVPVEMYSTIDLTASEEGSESRSMQNITETDTSVVRVREESRLTQDILTLMTEVGDLTDTMDRQLPQDHSTTKELQEIRQEHWDQDHTISEENVGTQVAHHQVSWIEGIVIPVGLDQIHLNISEE